MVLTADTLSGALGDRVVLGVGLGLHMASYDVSLNSSTSGNDGQDVKEINVLNHYIGMHDLKEDDFTELQWMPFALGALALLFLRAAVHGAIREREEALRAADRAKDEFLAMLGHELRNPLGALSSASQVLNVAEPGALAARDAASVVSRQVERMTRLVDDLLDVGRVISGKVSLQLAPVDLGKVVSQVIQNLRRASFFRRQDVRVDIEPAWVNGDETRIEQIVFNLLENAGKYTPADGSISVRVFEEDGSAVLEIADSGIGMSPELLPRVFDLFSQGQRSIDRGASGLGIGLTLVKRLAEMHGGTVTAESAGVDRGSLFRLRLASIEPPVQPASLPMDPVRISQLRRVLLIEDNEDARRTLRAALELNSRLVQTIASSVNRQRISPRPWPGWRSTATSSTATTSR